MSKSSNNRSLALTICNLEETDLCLDLDDDDDDDETNLLKSNLNKIESSINNKQSTAKESEDANNLFAKPAIKLLGDIDQINKTKSTNSITNNKLPKESFEALDAENTLIFEKFDNNQIDRSIFQELFDDEDEEDEFIKTQPIFASTQNVQVANNKQSNTITKPIHDTNSNSIQTTLNSQYSFPRPIDPKPKEMSSAKLPNNENPTTSSNSFYRQSPQKSSRQPQQNESVEDSNSTKINGLALLNILAENKVWNYAKVDLIDTFNQSQMDFKLIETYNISYYFKKFFEYDLLMRSSENSIRKLPILCVWIKEINRKTNNATVLLADPSNEIKGTLANSIIKDNWSSFMIGSVLVLQDVCLLRVNFNKNCYHLNINISNLLCVYYPNLEEPFDQINKLQLKQLESNKLNKLIDDFEKTYTHFDYLAHLAETSMNNTSNAANRSKSLQSKSNSSSNLNGNNNSNNKPAPYHIPPQYNKSNQNRAQLNSNTNSTRSCSSFQGAASAATKTTSSSSIQHNPTSNILIQSTTNSKPQNQQLNQSINNRNFQFRTPSSNNSPALSVIDSNKEKNNNDLLSPTTNNIETLKANNALTEEIFSQLIFGIEDELLKDDDF